VIAPALKVLPAVVLALLAWVLLLGLRRRFGADYSFTMETISPSLVTPLFLKQSGNMQP
jgi:hypothetical protein